MRKGKVYNNDIEAGIISEEFGGGYVFRYLDEYFLNVNMPPISLTFPKNKQQYHSEILFPFFFNMLSEGSNKKIQERMLKLSDGDYFGFLLKTGGHETIGAIRVEEISN